jgi:hypothetical protein
MNPLVRLFILFSVGFLIGFSLQLAFGTVVALIVGAPLGFLFGYFSTEIFRKLGLED